MPLSALLAAAAPLAGCRLAASTAAKTLVYGTTEKVTDPDPAQAHDFATSEILHNVFQGLMSHEPGTTILAPGLAESYSASPTADEFSFTLRRNLRFSDGTPLSARAVKWSVDRTARLRGDASRMVTDFVAQVDVLDERTVRFKLKAPAAFFPSLVALPPYFPVSPKTFPADRIVHDIDELPGGRLVGPGPYSVVSVERGREIVLEANPKSRGARPDVKRIVIRTFADSAALRLALERGEIDLAFRGLRSSDIGELSRQAGIVAHRASGAQIRYLCFETSELVFKDKRLRQAVAALVDRQEIVDRVHFGQSSPLYSMVPVGVPFHAPSFRAAYGERPDVARAEKLLAAAGYTETRPLRFDLWYAPGRYGEAEAAVAETLKTQLGRTRAIVVTARAAPWAAFKEQWKRKQMPAWLLGWYPDYADADNYAVPFAGSDSSRSLGINFSRPEWERWFGVQRSSLDPAVRREAFEALQNAWAEEVPTIPLWQTDLHVLARSGVKDVKIGPTLMLNYDRLRLE